MAGSGMGGREIQVGVLVKEITQKIIWGAKREDKGLAHAEG